MLKENVFNLITSVKNLILTKNVLNVIKDFKLIQMEHAFKRFNKLKTWDVQFGTGKSKFVFNALQDGTLIKKENASK